MSHEPFESQLLPFQALRLNSRHFFPPPLLFVGFAPCCAFSFASSHLALETRASGEGPSGVEYTEDGPRTERTRALMVYDTPTFDLSFGIMILENLASLLVLVPSLACLVSFLFHLRLISQVLLYCEITCYDNGKEGFYKKLRDTY